jgi:hypothetical protein
MTFISLAQAARRLSIDGKTLHRWLADAGLVVQPHPSDGRQKGVSLAQLHTLAQLHQRQLACLSRESSSAADMASPALLALAEQLAALETQIGLLRAEVADLTGFLQQHAVAPTSPTASPPLRQPPVKFASPSRRSAGSTVAPKAPRTPTHVIPRVEYAGEGRYVVICPKQGRLPLEPDTPEWFDWVRTQSSFRFVGQRGHFSAHHEWLVPRGAWRAHRQIRNQSYSLRLAPNADLTIAVLEQAAAALQAHLS